MRQKEPNYSENAGQLDRRQFVGMMSVGGLALFAAAPFDFLSVFFGKREAFNLPPEWHTLLGRPLKGYAAFVGGLQLKRVTVRQVIEPHTKIRGGIHSGIPPTSMWKSMKPTLLVADQIAGQLSEKIDTVVSAYRSPAYNALCPGAASHSQHLRNVALDLQFRSSPETVAAVAHELRDRGKFRGGIGCYPTFTHVDTRGTNVDWG